MIRIEGVESSYMHRFSNFTKLLSYTGSLAVSGDGLGPFIYVSSSYKGAGSQRVLRHLSQLLMSIGIIRACSA